MAVSVGGLYVEKKVSIIAKNEGNPLICCSASLASQNPLLPWLHRWCWQETVRRKHLHKEKKLGIESRAVETLHVSQPLTTSETSEKNANKLFIPLSPLLSKVTIMVKAASDHHKPTTILSSLSLSLSLSLSPSHTLLSKLTPSALP